MRTTYLMQIGKTDGVTLFAVPSLSDICKFCWTHAQYKAVAKSWPFTKAWWEQVPTPIRVKVTRGHSGPVLDDDARGKPLPPKLVPVLHLLGYLAHAPEISREGFKCGKLCGMSSKNNVHFSIDVYDETVYKKAQEQLAKGDLRLPAKIGDPPRYDYNAEDVLNCDETYGSGICCNCQGQFYRSCSLC